MSQLIANDVTNMVVVNKIIIIYILQFTFLVEHQNLHVGEEGIK
jgi:Flp pilus assembly protein protease CpaA